MSLTMLAGFVFVAVSASVVGVYMLLVGRSQAARDKTIEHRLFEVGGGAPAAADAPAAGDEDSLLRKQATGALPGVEVMARNALKGSQFERWLEQSGMAMSLSACLLISVGLGVLGALLALTFSHRV